MNRLVEIIRSEVEKAGVIPFARFMELALYCPVYGYYEKETDTIGRRGDYLTSVSIGSLFGELLAWQFAEWLVQISGGEANRRAGFPVAGSSSPPVSIVEAGAHHGRLAMDILSWLRGHRHELFRNLRYWIVEPSARRRNWQQELLAEFRGHVRWVEDLGELVDSTGVPTLRGIIFSNELLDAMPAHRLGWDAERRRWFEWGVSLRGGNFVWTRIEAIPTREYLAPDLRQPPAFTSAAALPEMLRQLLPDGFTTEFCPAAEQWWSQAAGVLQAGKLLTIDYGLAAEEFFAPERRSGTLRAYYRHHLGDDLLSNPGGQDLTAHVNFTVIRDAGERAGLTTDAFVDQAKFLTRIGERIWSSQAGFGDWTSARTRQFQTLVHPEQLGRAFRVLVQSRGC